MEELSKKELVLKQAKLAINFGVGVIAFASIWVFQFTIFPDFFKPEPTIVEFIPDSTEPESVSYFELDSADIENGIHVPTGLIVDDGCQDVMVTCGACHSLDLVTQNRATRDGWKEIIVWMQETQKLWDLGEKEVVILDYLAKNYAPENTGRRKNIENIEWYNL